MNKINNKSHTYKFNFVDLILILLCITIMGTIRLMEKIYNKNINLKSW